TSTLNSIDTEIGMVNDRLGASIAVSENYLAASGRGFVMVYDRAADGSLSNPQRISAPAGSGINDFGTAYVGANIGPNRTLALTDERLVVGAPLDSNSQGSSQGGTVSTFLRVGGNWVYQAGTELKSPTVLNQQRFGMAIAMADDTLIVSSTDQWFQNSPSNRNGVIHSYDWDGTAWVPTPDSPLIHPDSGSFHEVGMHGPAISGDGRAIVALGVTGLLYCWERKELGGWTAKPSIDVDISNSRGREVYIDPVSGTVLLGEHQSTFGRGPQIFVLEQTQQIGTALVDWGRAQLYHEEASNDPRFEVDNAAFRFLVNQYEDSGISQERSDPDSPGNSIDELFTEADDARVELVLAAIREQAATGFFDNATRDLYLDIIYDRAQVDVLRAQEALAELDIARLSPPPPNGCVIDNEIAKYTGATGSIQHLRNALERLLSVLRDDAGNPDASTPAGFAAYTSRASLRPLKPARYLNASGDLVNVTDSAGDEITGNLSSGYKDQILLFELLGEYGRSVAELSHLYLLKGEEALATSAIRAARELVFFQGNIVREIFGSPADLHAGILEWQQALDDLNTAEAAFSNGLNPLGFDPNFLFLVGERTGDEVDQFHSFDVLEIRRDNDDSTSNFIEVAEVDRIEAIGSYDDFKGGFDELGLGLDAVSGDARGRLTLLTGLPGPDFSSIPGPNNANDGGFLNNSILHDQFLPVRAARLRILKNSTEIDNLEARIRIEVAKTGTIQGIVADFGDQRVALEEEIAKINEIKAYTQVAVNAANPATWKDVGTSALNAYSETLMGEIAVEKERLAARENIAIIGAESAALIRTWLLDMKTLALSSQESSILLQQEVSRLANLLLEKEALERRIATHSATFQNRYFADPIHRLRFQYDAYIADRSFRRAQQFLFFYARALAYKYNESFDSLLEGKTINGSPVTMGSIYKARNSSELRLIAEEIEDVDLGRNLTMPDLETDVFSLKQDAFGYVENGNTYPDPITGLPVSATEAFRSLLKKEYRRTVTFQGDPEGIVRLNIPFSTVRFPLRTISGQTFFQGAFISGFDPVSGELQVTNNQDAGTWGNKIRQIAITVPGSHSFEGATIGANLTYGGTSYIRTPSLGRYTERLDPNDPGSAFRLDSIQGNLTTGPALFSSLVRDEWQSTDQAIAFGDAALVPSPLLPVAPADDEYFSDFFERSVASNGWIITLTLKQGTTYASIDQMDDVLIHFRHYFYVRQ
ncbi:MAG: hypothetical protein ACR2RV_11480, partial [Verrucomicrobiales bacterium]